MFDSDTWEMRKIVCLHDFIVVSTVLLVSIAVSCQMHFYVDSWNIFYNLFAESINFWKVCVNSSSQLINMVVWSLIFSRKQNSWKSKYL